MNFTREPIIETIITSKEGYKLVVRNSKGVGQEEYFVEALEIVSFGNAFFFRSLERAKSFFVPVTDYEVLEVRETKVMLKHVAMDRTIKISGGRDSSLKASREGSSKGNNEEVTEKKDLTDVPSLEDSIAKDKKRERRRYRRRRGGKDEKQAENLSEEDTSDKKEEKKSSVVEAVPKPKKDEKVQEPKPSKEKRGMLRSAYGSLLPPPPTLISESIDKYKEQFSIKEEVFVEEPSPDDLIEECPSEALTEILPQGENLEEDRGIVSEEELLGERTGEGATEVLHTDDEVAKEEKGLAFPSMWFPFLSSDKENEKDEGKTDSPLESEKKLDSSVEGKTVNSGEGVDVE